MTFFVAMKQELVNAMDSRHVTIASMVVLYQQCVFRVSHVCKQRRGQCGSVLQSGQFNEDMIPTVGFNMRKITKGNVTIKVSVQHVAVIVVTDVCHSLR